MMEKILRFFEKYLIPKPLYRLGQPIYHFLLAFFAALIYGFPSKKMVIIGVLGTRGKTTAANYIWSCLETAGYKTGLTGTANIRIGTKEYLNKYHMTMPGRFALQKILAKMVKAGCQYAVIETPSEGVEQWRHKGIIYDIAVLTVVYPEFLEAHNWDFERCKIMTAKIFRDLKNSPRKKINGKKIPKIAVLNSDNPNRDFFLQFDADRKITYGLLPGADFRARGIKTSNDGVSFQVGQMRFQLKMFGRFNVSNALAAITVASALGVNEEKIKKGLIVLTNVPGRMEKIEENQKFSVFVDYSHDEVSLRSVLEAVRATRKIGRQKIILLLGAEGGGRDRLKRPKMGELAAHKADCVIISNVDPYDDNPKVILEDIASASERAGKKRNKNLFVIEDRRKGIKKALFLAKKNDIVLITGKGAEQSMIIGEKRIKWDDRIVVREELRKLKL